MARPTETPDWATNANYAAGPDIGTATKIGPTVGRIQDGWQNGAEPPAQYQNWWQDVVRQWVDWLDAPAVDFTDLEDQPVGVGRIVFVPGIGFYSWFSTFAPGADAFWAIASTDTGFWLHQSVSASGGGRMAFVGPVPGDSWVPATVAGRINQSVIPYGRYAHVVTDVQQFVTTSMTLVTFSLANFGALAFAVGDIVSLEGSCIIAADEDVEIGPAISTDGGTTWIGMHDTGAADVYAAYEKPITTGRNVTVAFAFTCSLVGATTGLRVALRCKMLAAGTVTATTSRMNAWVRRP